MSDLISREALIKEIRERAGMWKQTAEVFCEVIEEQLTVEAVSKSYVDQIRWERDVAIEQLNEIGCQFGQKMDEVKKKIEAPQWIPCSERMPTEKETWEYNADENLYEPNEFIVQVKGAKLPTVAMFDGETFTNGYAENGYGFMDEIIAWQPLPEPYKGEQHERIY